MRTRKQLLWWLLAGTKGGNTRILILAALADEPQNANQLAQRLSLDYKTVRHHLSLLSENGLIEGIGAGYANSYFLSDLVAEERELVNGILRRKGMEELK